MVHGYLDELGIAYCGRYGDWAYIWTDESFMSGEQAAEKVLSCKRRPRARGQRGNMKVVLFCGGLGMRMREYSEAIPKPMVPIGYRPILWHVMKYYAHYGHKEFILCLGYSGDVIKNYFLNYDEMRVQRLRAVEGRQEASSCSPATSTTGRSPSSTPGSTRTSASASKAVRAVPRGRRRCSWPTTPTA